MDYLVKFAKAVIQIEKPIKTKSLNENPRNWKRNR